MRDLDDFVEIPFSPRELALHKKYSSGQHPAPRCVALPIEGYMWEDSSWSRVKGLTGLVVVSFILFFSYLDAQKGEAAVCGKFHQTHGLQCLGIDLLYLVATASFFLKIFSDALRARADFLEASHRPSPHLKIDRSAFWHVQLAEAIRLTAILSVSEIEKAGIRGGRVIGLEFQCREPPRLAYSTEWNSASAPSCSFRFSLEGFRTTAGKDALNAIKALVQSARPSDVDTQQI